MSLSPLLPRVAVVVPVFNRAHCILATLDSILAQTLRPAQVIVVDNGSTDHSKAVVEAWMQQQKPHCELLLLSEACRGASAARNRGLQAVTTEWVSFFDSDDLMSPDFLERMLGCAQAQEKEWVIARTQMVFAPNTLASFPKRIVRWSTSQPTLVDHILGACISTKVLWHKHHCYAASKDGMSISRCGTTTKLAYACYWHLHSQHGVKECFIKSSSTQIASQGVV